MHIIINKLRDYPHVLLLLIISTWLFYGGLCISSFSRSPQNLIQPPVNQTFLTAFYAAGGKEISMSSRATVRRTERRSVGQPGAGRRVGLCLSGASTSWHDAPREGTKNGC